MIRVTLVSHYTDGSTEPKVRFCDLDFHSDLSGFTDEEPISALLHAVREAMEDGNVVDVYVEKELAEKLVR